MECHFVLQQHAKLPVSESNNFGGCYQGLWPGICGTLQQSLWLWYNIVPSDELRDLADVLCAVKPKQGMLQEPKQRFGTGFDKPKFHEEIKETTKLSHLVNEIPGIASKKS